jgi:hypothetical protein
VDAMKSRGMTVFDGVSGGFYRDYDLNIVGIRSANRMADLFDDWYVIFYRVDKKWEIFCCEATTDPGRESLMNPVFPEAVKNGALILCEGIQFRSAYKLGRHGTGAWNHKALVQVRPVAGYRDANRDAVLDMRKETVQWGMWGANHHAASLNSVVDRVGNWSAGCQVIRRPDDYTRCVYLWEKAASLWGPYFSYSILMEDWVL